MQELMEFQPSLLVFCLVACFVIVYTCNYYMFVLHIILRWGGVIGPNSGLVPWVKVLLIYNNNKHGSCTVSLCRRLLMNIKQYTVTNECGLLGAEQFQHGKLHWVGLLDAQCLSGVPSGNTWTWGGVWGLTYTKIGWCLGQLTTLS